VSVQEESSSAGSADEVVELARAREGEALAAFARAYLHRAPSADGAEADAEALLAEVRGAFGVADTRGGAVAAVRAFTPYRGEHGYETAGSVLETNTDDLPFLVDSITAELAARGLRAVRVTHPIVGVRREAGGDGGGAGRDGGQRPCKESIHAHVLRSVCVIP
jgi:glutamate dehydrogenase